MIDLRLQIKPQRDNTHGTFLSFAHLLHVVLVHAERHLQAREIRDLYQTAAAPQPITLADRNFIHHAVDARREALPVGQVNDLIPGGYLLILGDVNLRDRRLAAVLQGLGVDGADGGVEAHGGGNVPRFRGIAGIEKLLRPCRHGVNVAVAHGAQSACARKGKYPPKPFACAASAGGFFLRCHAFLPSRLRDAFSGNRPHHMPAF